MVRDSKVYACPHTNLGKVLFNCLIFCDKEIRDLSNKIIEFSAVEFPKFCLYPLLFRLLNDRQENLSNLSNFEGFHESKMKKIKGLTELSLGLSLFLWSLSLIAKAILLIFPTANDSPNLAQRLLTVFFLP